MPVQAIPLALLASLYPLGIAAVLVFTEAVRPRPKEGVFVIGAAACTLAVGFVVAFALHGAGLGQSSQQSDQYWLRLATGVFFILAAVVVARRRPSPHTGPSRVSRAASQGGLLAVFVVGMALYLPSPFYLSALQVVATTKMSTAAMAVWVVIVVALVLITIEVPVLLYLLAPGWTVPRLQAVNGWLTRNGRTLAVAVLGAIGLWELLDGLVGLLS
jgi:Sap, sulfolipid-1-addressing protein